MTRLVGNRFVHTGLVLLALAALYGLAVLSRPSGRAHAQQGRRAVIASTVAACPDPASGRGVSTRVSAVEPPGSGGGKAEIGDTRGSTPIATLTMPGRAWATDVRGAAGAYVIRADGAMATGLQVEQTSVAESGGRRGIAGTRCAEPATDMWFLGTGPADAGSIDLFLTNVDDQTSAVDVEGLSGDGPLETADGRGTTVEAHTTRLIRIGKEEAGLGKAVTAARTLALHVHVTSGRLAAAVRVGAGSGKGVDWIPAAQQPATRLVVPAVPAGSGRRRLLVAVPGDTDTRMKIQVITRNGAFAPEGQEVFEAPAQTVTPVDLDKVLSGRAAAVSITADQPVTAGLVAEQSYRGGGDVAYVAAQPALSDGGIVADARARSGMSSTLLLTAPAGDAAVRVSTVTGRGVEGQPAEVKIRGGTTAEVRLRPVPGADGGFGVVLAPQPGSAPIYAGRVLTLKVRGGAMLTVLPVGPAHRTVAVPGVAESSSFLLP